MQTHAMAEAERVLWVHLAQPQLQQGHQEQSAQAHVQLGFEGLQGGDYILWAAYARALSHWQGKCVKMSLL